MVQRTIEVSAEGTDRMRTLAEVTGRDGREYRVAVAPNGTYWFRVRLATGHWYFWKQEPGR